MTCAFCGGKAVCFALHDLGDSGVPVCNDTALLLNVRGYRLAGLKGAAQRLDELREEAASPQAIAALPWKTMRQKPEGEARE